MRRILVSIVTASLAGGLPTLAACSDDDASAGATVDSGADVVQPPPPPPPPNFPDPPAPPPDLVSRTGYLGDATLVADVGEPTDGPSWHDGEGALYFTVPASASPLRRVGPGGAATIVPYEDAGGASVAGSGNGGGARVYLTEPSAIVSVDVDDAGVSGLVRTTGLGGTVFGDIAVVAEDAGTRAFFVDTSGARAYRFTPPSDLTLLTELDAGRTTGIAAASVSDQTVLYVATSGASANAVNVYTIGVGGALTAREPIRLGGIPPNAIAADELGRVYVAWAKGIQVVEARGGLDSTADPQVPIGAVPTSLAFGGADRRTLYVTTAAGKIYALAAQATGVLR